MVLENIDINHIVTHYFYSFVRISSLFFVIPFFSSKTIPIKIKVLFAILVTFLVAPLLPATPAVEPLSFTGGLMVAHQILIGVAIGLVFQFIFQIVVLGGQIIALQGGLGYATLVDPQSHETLPMISQFYQMIITLLFLSMNGHIAILQMIVDSFYTLPVGNYSFSTDQIYQLITFAGIIFSGAVSIALPAIVALLAVNITFAIMSKSAPQLNIFTIGFPLTLMLGLAVMYIIFPDIAEQTQVIFNDGFHMADNLINSTPSSASHQLVMNY